MSETEHRISQSHKPWRVRALVTALLAAPPAAWALQLIASYGVSSHACYPAFAPLAQPGPAWSWGGALAINLVALSICLAAVLAAISFWLGERDRGGVEADIVNGSESGSLLLPAWGVLISMLFFVAVLFNTLQLIVIRQCGA